MIPYPPVPYPVAARGEERPMIAFVQKVSSWPVPLESRWNEVMWGACGDEPEADALGFREAAEWVRDGDAACEVMYFSMGEDEDFARLPPDDQRTYLMLAANALYGPYRDDETLGEAVIAANPE